MLRRLSALGCALALLVALVVATFHHHESASGAQTTDSAGCMYCAGGMAAAEAPDVVPAVERIWLAPVERPVEAPAHAWRQPLSHSGNAPPA